VKLLVVIDEFTRECLTNRCILSWACAVNCAVEKSDITAYLQNHQKTVSHAIWVCGVWQYGKIGKILLVTNGFSASSSSEMQFSIVYTWIGS